MVSLESTSSATDVALHSALSTSSPLQDRLKAVRSVKNSVIGNKTKKDHFLNTGIAPLLVNILADSNSSTELKLETVVALGSFAHGNPSNIQRLLLANPIPSLLALLPTQQQLQTALFAASSPQNSAASDQLRFIEAVAKALRAILGAGAQDSFTRTYSSITAAITGNASSLFSSSDSSSDNNHDTKNCNNQQSNSASAWKADVFKSHHISTLISLIYPFSPSIGQSHPDLSSIPSNTVAAAFKISEVAASILAKIAGTIEEQNSIAAAGALPALVSLLSPPIPYPKLQEAALEAMANLSRENKAVSDAIVSCRTQEGEKSVVTITRLLRDKRVDMRLLAATCLTNLHRTSALPKEHMSDIQLLVLPSLIKLFAEKGTTGIQERAPLVFATLVSDSEELQKVAMESDAIPKLATLLEENVNPEDELLAQAAAAAAAASSSSSSTSATASINVVNSGMVGRSVERKNLGILIPGFGTKPASFTSQTSIPNLPHPEIPLERCLQADRIRESALLAIAALCSLREECRKHVIEAKVLPQIVNSMSSSQVGIRAAACLCTRSLSRSVKNLRTSLVDAGIAVPLFKLLSDENVQVQITASATLCNIVLDFSPMKKTVLESGGVEKLVALTHASDTHLRLNAVWALKNLLFQADSDVKQRVTKELTWPGLFALMNDGEMGIQEQALNLLRNLACGKESDIDQVFHGAGESRLMGALEEKLLVNTSDELVLQALYIIVNIATGNERHKLAVMSRESLLKAVQKYMGHPKGIVRVAAIWCVINLTWVDDQGSEGRVARLRDLGFEAQLQEMMDDVDLDVKDRVKTAIEHFRNTHDERNSAPMTAMPPPTNFPPAGAATPGPSVTGMTLDQLLGFQPLPQPSIQQQPQSSASGGPAPRRLAPPSMGFFSPSSGNASGTTDVGQYLDFQNSVIMTPRRSSQSSQQPGQQQPDNGAGAGSQQEQGGNGGRGGMYRF